jgi:hypothetical protein
MNTVATQAGSIIFGITCALLCKAHWRLIEVSTGSTLEIIVEHLEKDTDFL